MLGRVPVSVPDNQMVYAAIAQCSFASATVLATNDYSLDTEQVNGHVLKYLKSEKAIGKQALRRQVTVFIVTSAAYPFLIDR